LLLYRDSVYFIESCHEKSLTAYAIIPEISWGMWEALLCFAFRIQE